MCGENQALSTWALAVVSMRAQTGFFSLVVHCNPLLLLTRPVKLHVRRTDVSRAWFVRGKDLWFAVMLNDQ